MRQLNVLEKYFRDQLAIHPMIGIHTEMKVRSENIKKKDRVLSLVLLLMEISTIAVRLLYAIRNND